MRFYFIQYIQNTISTCCGMDMNVSAPAPSRSGLQGPECSHSAQVTHFRPVRVPGAEGWAAQGFRSAPWPGTAGPPPVSELTIPDPIPCPCSGAPARTGARSSCLGCSHAGPFRPSGGPAPACSHLGVLAGAVPCAECLVHALSTAACPAPSAHGHPHCSTSAFPARPHPRPVVGPP